MIARIGRKTRPERRQFLGLILLAHVGGGSEFCLAVPKDGSPAYFDGV
ncbi:hypothetical protein [Roseinatronobacter monicus]|uniref:Uncharacterized protein n=1 Tax=Roseinatronobacter monicus TaxID=393481 RepID=A0A543KI53_9RHOB|nr:hypothetical protein [Roseinatronobacter monicus]TQM94761.1 hypothetical protein BD293_3448 [Roseinatronobacter monicus]